MIALLLLSIIFVSSYIYTTKNHGYWAKRKIKYERPLPIFGNHLRNILGLKSITELSTEYYNKYPHEKVVGYYRGTTPELIIRDPVIAKNVLTMDFAYFYPRGMGRDIQNEPLLGNLFHADGDLWKLLRQRITPAFTTAKCKAMFPLAVNCAKKLQVVAETLAKNDHYCDIRELVARFSTDFIGACGFGIEVNTVNNENIMFRELGKIIYNHYWTNKVLVPLWELFPEIRKLLPLTHKEVEDKVSEIVRQVCELRNFKPSGRNDFVDFLLELQCKGVMKGSSIEHVGEDGNPHPIEKDMDFLCLTAQIFIFFAAGYETTSSSMSFTLHQLAFHPEIQKNIQTEIDQAVAKHNELCYDSVLDMKLLRMAFMESMRMFSPVGVLHRVCAKKYTFPDLGITIDRGVKIQIPIQAIHQDENYFNDPLEFKPERFENSKKDHLEYIPYGSGPRKCIAARLGELLSLVGLAALLHKFSVEPAANTCREPEIDHGLNVIQGVKGGLPLKLKIREHI